MPVCYNLSPLNKKEESVYMKNITGIFLCKMILLIILPCMPVFCFSATGDSSLVVKFKNNRPAVTGSYTKGVRNGEWKYFYKNGNVRYSIIYKESLAEGPVKYYSKNKKVLFEGNFSMGMHDGEWKYYYPSGELESEKFFHCGKTLKTWKHYSEGGKIDAQYNMDSAGIGFIDYKFLATPFVEFKLADSFITNKNNCFHLEWSLYTNHEVTEEYETKGSKLNGIYFSSDIHAKCYQTGNGCGLGMLATLQEGSYKAGKKENSWVTNTIEKWKDTIHAAILLISQSKITGTYSADTLNGEFSLSEKNKVYEPEAFFNIEKKAYYSHGILDGRFSSRDSFRPENGLR